MKFTKPCITKEQRDAAAKRRALKPKPYFVWGILKNGAVDEINEDVIENIDRLAICLEYQAKPGDVFEVCRIECVPCRRQRSARKKAGAKPRRKSAKS